MTARVYMDRERFWCRDFAAAVAMFAAALLAASLAAAQEVEGQAADTPAATNGAATPEPNKNGKEGEAGAGRAGEAEPAVAQSGKKAVEKAADVNLTDGRLLRVRLPLTGNADAHIKSSILRAAAQLRALPRRGDGRPVLVLELVAKGGAGGYGEGTEFSRAQSLADFLLGPELNGIKTVAFVPRTIKGHGVLVALACESIAMPSGAEIGEAGIDEDTSRPIKPNIIAMYEQVASQRSIPAAIVVGMVDPSVEVLKVETDEATEYVLGGQLEKLKQKHTLATPPEIIKPAGSLGSFTGSQGRDYKAVQLLADDRRSLAQLMSLRPEAVEEDQSLVGDWRPIMVSIDGPVTPRKARQLDTTIASETRDRGTNWVGVRIDSAGGQLADCLRVADRLAGVDAADVQTVAYVPMDASGGAALIALACDQIVMQPEAQIGGKSALPADRQMLDAARESIRGSLGTNSRHGWSLLLSTIDPEIELFSYHNKGTGEVRYFSPEEVAEQQKAEDWVKGPRIKPAGELLKLNSQRAQELGIATHVVDSFDDLKQLYGFKTDPRSAEPNWALELIEALSSPSLAVVLLVIGFVGIYVELHTPGVGAGAFVAAVAFMLFFWSQFLHGTAGWLEVLLFVGGLLFLLIEMLLLPGFGVFGLGGGLMILASLVLASQTFVLPQSESELRELRHSLTIVAGTALCVVVAAVALRRYLPQAPVFRSILLAPPAEEDLIDLDHREALADFTHLIGQQGIATTNLMPAGKAEFDGQLIDVIADGLPIERGQAVVVTKARGNRVTVHAVEGTVSG